MSGVVSGSSWLSNGPAHRPSSVQSLQLLVGMFCAPGFSRRAGIRDSSRLLLSTSLPRPSPFEQLEVDGLSHQPITRCVGMHVIAGQIAADRQRIAGVAHHLLEIDDGIERPGVSNPVIYRLPVTLVFSSSSST